MQKSLGILVSSDKHLDKLIGICEAARIKNVIVYIFLTHFGVILTQDSNFHKLEGLASISVCNVNFEKFNLKPPIPGIKEKDYATQTRNAIMVTDCDRYIVL